VGFCPIVDLLCLWECNILDWSVVLAPKDTRPPPDPVVGIEARTPWRSLTQDQEVSGLVAQYALAQQDAVRARASLERLITLCRPVAETIARTYTAHELDVADMMQEALLMLARDLPALRNPSAFPSWFASVAHNVGRKWLRRERARLAEVSLDVPPRPGWLGAGEGPQPRDVPDPASARSLVGIETTEHLRGLLRTLPEQQRTALVAAFVAGSSHEQIGQELGVTPRAAEGLVYRGLRRLQAIAGTCTEEPEEINVWCPRCGQRRLIAQLLPGVDPAGPLWLRWRCPACDLASAWTEPNIVPLSRYASLEAAWWHERIRWAECARRFASGRQRRCWKCGEPLLRRDRESSTGRAPLYVLHWSCFKCDVGNFYGYLPASGLQPEWPAFWRTAPRLLLDPERVVKTAGEAQVVLTATDRDTNRRATIAVARDSLDVRRFEVEAPHRTTRRPDYVQSR